ncbi:hypothetical protein Pelo_6681 [Pelomyxa schiedti]|nr:hypothetical protein Pelo_6681 [Pelomyxa schiedti]
MPPLMWRNIMASTRNMVTVAKQLMVCFVEPLPVCQDQSIESLISMPPFAVKKLIFERWVPTQNRDQNL